MGIAPMALRTATGKIKNATYLGGKKYIGGGNSGLKPESQL
jgi:hypothetical protein